MNLVKYWDMEFHRTDIGEKYCFFKKQKLTSRPSEESIMEVLANLSNKQSIKNLHIEIKEYFIVQVNVD